MLTQFWTIFVQYTSCTVSVKVDTGTDTLQKQFRLYIPFLGIARPQPQFQHSCVLERFIYSQDQSTYFLQQNRQTDRGNIFIIRSQTHECRNWDWGPDIPFLGIFASNFRNFVFAVQYTHYIVHIQMYCTVWGGKQNFKLWLTFALIG